METIETNSNEEVIEQNFWRLTEFSEKVGGKHRNTIDAWFNQLEARGIHYVNRTQSGERVFNELDLKIAKYIAKLRNENWGLDAIYDALPHQYSLREFPADDSFSRGETLNAVDVYKNINSMVSKQINLILEDNQKQIELLVKQNADLREIVKGHNLTIESLQQQLLALPEPIHQDNTLINDELEKITINIKTLEDEINVKRTSDEQREKNLEHLTTNIRELEEQREIEVKQFQSVVKELEEKLRESERNSKRQRNIEQRVKRELRLEAHAKWMEKPENERFDIVGFISKKKIEKADAKRVFLEEYEAEHFESRFKKIEQENID